MSPGPEGAGRVALEAPAKVNVFLRVLAREASGYHQIETLLAAISLSDLVEVTRVGEGGLTLEVTGADLGAPEDNLAYRAARAFLDAAGLGDAGISIRVEKRIPVGAGLGGGSSDAAAVLRALQRLFGDPLEVEHLAHVAGALGADVPFFLCPTTLALGWGRGDRLLPLPPLPGCPVLLALPGLSVATAWAYRELAEARAGRDEAAAGARILPAEAFSSWESAGALAANDFEEVVFRAQPRLAALAGAMRRAGAPRTTLLAGSGAALFSLHRTRRDAEHAAAALAPGHPDAGFVVVRTLETFPGV